MEEHTLHIYGVPKDAYSRKRRKPGLSVLNESLLPGKPRRSVLVGESFLRALAVPIQRGNRGQ